MGVDPLWSTRKAPISVGPGGSGASPNNRRSPCWLLSASPSEVRDRRPIRKIVTELHARHPRKCRYATISLTERPPVSWRPPGSVAADPPMERPLPAREGGAGPSRTNRPRTVQTVRFNN